MDNICQSCFGLQRGKMWKEHIKEFADAWLKSGMSITYKVHVLVQHVPEYFDCSMEKNNNGLAWTSEQGLESCHQKVNRMWDLFKTGEENKYYPSRLKNLIISYLYRLPWELNRLKSDEFQTEIDKDISLEALADEDLEVDEIGDFEVDQHQEDPLIEEMTTLNLTSNSDTKDSIHSQDSNSDSTSITDSDPEFLPIDP